MEPGSAALPSENVHQNNDNSNNNKHENDETILAARSMAKKRNVRYLCDFYVGNIKFTLFNSIFGALSTCTFIASGL